MVPDWDIAFHVLGKGLGEAGGNFTHDCAEIVLA
jgi:hypothetical protein